MSVSATCHCTSLHSPSQLSLCRSTAFQVPTYQRPGHLSAPSASRSPRAAWPIRAPKWRSATCPALPGSVGIAALADAGMPDIGGVIDSLVSSGATVPVTEIVQDFQTFEPQLNPFVAVAALAAAVPPVLFWGRVFMNAQRRIKEDEQKEEERQERKKKIFGP